MTREEARLRLRRSTRRNFYILIGLTIIAVIVYQSASQTKSSDTGSIVLGVVGGIWLVWPGLELIRRLTFMFRYASKEGKQKAAGAAIVAGTVGLALLKALADSKSDKAKTSTTGTPSKPQPQKPITSAKPSSARPLTEKSCPTCKGQGKVTQSITQECSTCKGTGEIAWEKYNPKYSDSWQREMMREPEFIRGKRTCDMCHGKGVETLPALTTCKTCAGRGKVTA